MKIKIKSPLDLVDSNVTSFLPVIITEEDYKEYEKLAINGYICTPNRVVRIYSKTTKQSSLFFLQAISTRVEIKECLQDISLNQRKYKIEVFNGVASNTIIADSDVLTASGCKQLLASGCIYDESQLRFFLHYLAQQACSTPIHYVHSRLGWSVINNTTVFLSGTSIPDSSSQYVGNLQLEPIGSLEEWLSMIKKEVLGNTALEFGTILGFASVVLGYLNKYRDLGCMVFNYSNSSSKGKTTVAMLAASVFGSPQFDDGLITTFNSTSNALVGFVSHANSHTVVIDEVATAEKAGARKTLYQFCTGRDRMRLKTDGTLRETHDFNSIIITTAEFPIIDETAPNGLRARVFEITGDLTTSAGNADAIKKCVFKNYGHAGIVFAKYIMNKLDAIVDDYDAIVKILEEHHAENDCESGELTKRILSKLAVVVLTAYYVKECFEMKLRVKNLINYCLALEQGVTGEIDIADKAIDCIVQYVARHGNRFISNNEEFCSAVDGKIRNTGYGKEITILKTVVENILKDNGFENPKILYKKWHEQKLLISERDRPYKRVRLTKDLPVQPCFILKINE